MKKLLIGLLIGFLITLPVGAMAWGEQRVLTAQDYYVDTFTNQGNTCYVAFHLPYPETMGAQPNTSISCVKD